MTDYEVDQRLGYSPCVCGVLDGTWHTKCYQGKTRAQLDEGQKNAYAVARRQLKNKVAEESNRAINRAMSRTGGQHD